MMNTPDTALLASPFYQWDTPYVHLAAVQHVDTAISLDSIFPLWETVEAECRESMFAGHTLGVGSDGLVARPDTLAPVWLFGMLLLLAGGHFLYFYLRKMRMLPLLKALFSRRAMERLVRDNNLKTSRLLSIALLVSASVGAVLWLLVPEMEARGIGGWLALCGVLLAAYLLRNGVYRMLGNVFDGKNAVNICITSNYFYHLALSTALVPLLFLAVYLPVGGEVVERVMAGALALCFLLRFSREVNLFLTFSQNVSFYLFYYLCTIETVPVIVLVKLFLLQ